MNPTLEENQIVVTIKKKNYNRGDIIAFSKNNQVMLKRVIGISNDKINIDKEGNIILNNNKLTELYILEKINVSLDIELPYIVPKNSYFVLGDNRNNSLDSKNIPIGSIKKEQIIGEVIFSLWPPKLVN